MKNYDCCDSVQAIKDQTGDIPWVIVKELLHNWFPIERVIFNCKPTTDLIAEIIAQFGKCTIEGGDRAIGAVLENANLTNETKIEICVMLIES